MWSSAQPRGPPRTHKQHRAIPRLQTGSRAHKSHSLFSKIVFRVCRQQLPELDYLQWSCSGLETNCLRLSERIEQHSTVERWSPISRICPYPVGPMTGYFTNLGDKITVHMVSLHPAGTESTLQDLIPSWLQMPNRIMVSSAVLRNLQQPQFRSATFRILAAAERFPTLASSSGRDYKA